MTADNQNTPSKRRQAQRFTLGGALTQQYAGALTKVYNPLVMKNCYVDQVVGGVVRRDGSSLETLASTVGLPLAMGEHVAPTVGGAIPVSSTPIVNFSGQKIQSRINGTWTDLTISDFLSLDTSKSGSIVMGPGEHVFIAGGQVAKWKGPGNPVQPVGLPPPKASPTITAQENSEGFTVAANDNYKWGYTYYNSDSGLESELSPLYPGTGSWSTTVASQFTVGVPTDTTEDIGGDITTLANKKRIYRNLAGGVKMYLVGTVDINQTEFIDSQADDFLTTYFGRIGTKKQPEQKIYIMAAYAQRMWGVDGSDNRRLRFTEAYTDNENDIEYWPEDNYITTSKPITGLIAIPGRLLVIHPRDVSQITGTSVDDFAINVYRSGIGTMFHTSLATNGRNVVFLAEEGWVDITQEKMHISAEIDEELQPLLTTEYNAGLYVSACYNPTLRQFILSVGAQALATEVWEDVDTGKIEAWEDATTQDTEIWETEQGTVPTAALRVKIWGWSPEYSAEGAQRWHEYTFYYVADNNVNGAIPLFVYHPLPSSLQNAPQQDRTYLGYFDGTNGKVAALFRRDKTQDESTSFEALLITGRIQPGELSQGKWFTHVGFPSSYVDPTSSGTCTIKYLLDFDEPHRRDYSASLITVPTDASEVKTLPQGRGHYIHLVISDTSTIARKPILQEFDIHFRERRRREMR